MEHMLITIIVLVVVVAIVMALIRGFSIPVPPVIITVA